MRRSKRTGGAGERNQAVGISRGDRSTKTHAIVDSKGRPGNLHALRESDGLLDAGAQFVDRLLVVLVLGPRLPCIDATGESFLSNVRDEAAGKRCLVMGITAIGRFVAQFFAPKGRPESQHQEGRPS